MEEKITSTLQFNEQRQIVNKKEIRTVDVKYTEDIIEPNFLLEQYNEAIVKFNDLEDEKLAFVNSIENQQIEVTTFRDQAEEILTELNLLPEEVINEEIVEETTHEEEQQE